MFVVVWTLAGLLVGGTVTVLASRLPGRRRLLAWPPRCHGSGEPVGLSQGFPVVGYLLQRGRCSRCGARLDVRFPVTEALCALSFGLLAWRFGPGPEAWIGSLYAAVLWLVFVIDWQHHLILNRVTYPTVPLALALSFAYPRTSVGSSIGGALVCGGAFLALYLVGRLLYRGRTPLGMGDVKLAVVMGAMLGVSGGLASLLFGVLAGAVQAIALLALGYRRRTYMPYGTALVVGAVAALLVGNETWRALYGG